MSTTLSLDPNIAARAKAVREGRELPKLDPKFESAPDAQPMSPDDVCNVEPLTADDYRALLRRLELSCPMLFAELTEAIEAADEQWGEGWNDSDERWTLTPHAVRRINERRRKATAAAK